MKRAHASRKRPRQRDRTFTGCRPCRERKVKCDESKPRCQACGQLKLDCDYEATLVWVNDDGSHDISSGRRSRMCEATWKDIPILDSESVDCLISQCDPEQTADATGVFQTAFFAPSCNPFTAFRLDHVVSQTGLVPANPWDMIDYDPLRAVCSISSTREERMLFHHYVNHVAVIMMPFEHPKNPWKSSYPARALQGPSTTQKSLFNALLAHAAFSMTHLTISSHENMAMASKYYGLSLRQLLESLNTDTQPTTDTLATVLTLMMAEIYSGQPKNWRHHFQGAWDLFRKFHARRPWEDSDWACASLQSLYIITIVGNTCRPPEADGTVSLDLLTSVPGDDSWPNAQEIDKPEGPLNTVRDLEIISMIKSTQDFGFTIGATQEILECISCINDLNRCRDWQQTSPLDSDHLLNRIDACRINLSDDVARGALTPAAHSQLEAFISATYVYFYRTIFDLAPQDLESYVVETLENVSLFTARGYGNMSLWPAFIASVEACSEKTTFLARAWLDNATSLGMGSRLLARKVIEETWQRRETAAQSMGLDSGAVAVDWRQVMKTMNVDVLLI